MKKVLLICVSSHNVMGFRKKLIEKLQSEGCEVSVIAFDDQYAEEIRRRGVAFYCLDDSNRGLNPLKVLSLKSRYAALIERIAPDTVFTFMLKPNLFGVLAAKKVGVSNIYSMVEGAGDVFIYNSLKWRLIRRFVCFMYKRAFRHTQKVFFLNRDDCEDFVQRSLLAEDRCEVIPGVGVDLGRFTYRPMTAMRRFIMIARMQRSKGLIEYLEAAKRVKALYPDAEFAYLGAEGNLTAADIQPYTDAGVVEYLGFAEDVIPYLDKATVHVLPTYREGLCLVNVEAGAIGRPSITCDTVGARDTVLDGYNGFLVKVGDVDALAERMIYCIEHPDEVRKMGENARVFVEERFDEKLINAHLVKAIGAERERTSV